MLLYYGRVASLSLRCDVRNVRWGEVRCLCFDLFKVLPPCESIHVLQVNKKPILIGCEGDGSWIIWSWCVACIRTFASSASRQTCWPQSASMTWFWSDPTPILHHSYLDCTPIMAEWCIPVILHAPLPPSNMDHPMSHISAGYASWRLLLSFILLVTHFSQGFLLMTLSVGCSSSQKGIYEEGGGWGNIEEGGG